MVEEGPRVMGLVICAAAARHRRVVCTHYLEEARDKMGVACCRVVMLLGVKILVVGLNS